MAAPPIKHEQATQADLEAAMAAVEAEPVRASPHATLAIGSPESQLVPVQSPFCANEACFLRVRSLKSRLDIVS